MRLYCVANWSQWTLRLTTLPSKSAVFKAGSHHPTVCFPPSPWPSAQRHSKGVCHIPSPLTRRILSMTFSFLSLAGMHSTLGVITSHPVSSPWLHLSSLHLFSMWCFSPLSSLLLVVPIWSFCWVHVSLSLLFVRARVGDGTLASAETVTPAGSTPTSYTAVILKTVRDFSFQKSYLFA